MYRTISSDPRAIATSIDAIGLPVREPDRENAPSLPFVVDQYGHPEPTIVAYVAANTRASARTVWQYARYLVKLANYLEATSGRRIWEAEPRDIEAYKVYRTEDQNSPVGRYSWKPEAAAIRDYYWWMTTLDIIFKSPIIRINRSGDDNLSIRANPPRAIRYVSNERYLALVRATTGESRNHTYRRADTRNLALIKTLVSTGMRIQEATCMLTIEFDSSDPLKDHVEICLEATAKFGKRRVVYVPSYAVQEIRKYRTIERRHHVASRQRTLQGRLPELFRVVKFEPITKKITGHWGISGDRRTYQLESLPIRERTHSVRVNDDWIEPLGLFISPATGLPTTRSAWEQVFRNLHVETLQYGNSVGARITPHDLRHTFAINYLKSRLEERDPNRLSESARLHPLRDPVIDLQRILGHASTAQTLNYVRYLDEIGDTIEASVEEYLEIE